MQTFPEAVVRAVEWEKQYGHPVERAWRAKYYGHDFDARLTPEEIEDGANRYLDVRDAERRERAQRKFAEAERIEARRDMFFDAPRGGSEP